MLEVTDKSKYSDIFIFPPRLQRRGVIFDCIHPTGISILEKIKIETDDVFKKIYSIPITYNSSNSNFIISGCKMSSHGIKKFQNNFVLNGIISSDNKDSKTFVTVLQNCEDKIRNLYGKDINDLFSERGRVKTIAFRVQIGDSDNQTEFYNIEDDLIDFNELIEKYMEFIPTFCIRDIIITPHCVKLRLILISAVVTKIVPGIIPYK
jgi:hypothetical protein